MAAEYLQNRGHNEKSILLITLGDPVGIGPEVTVKALASGRLSKDAVPLVVGPPEPLYRAFHSTGVFMETKEVEPYSEISIPSNKVVYILRIDCDSLSGLQWGRPSKETGQIAGLSILKAVELLTQGKAQALVTGPLCKEVLNSAGYKYPGQTEMLAELTGTDKFAMTFIGGGLKVGVLTTHCPISEVPKQLTQERILEKLEVINSGLKEYFGLNRPKIGVCSLNPHSGEGGLLGSEEITEINPAIQRARQEGIEALGPFAADTLFCKAEEMKLDAILAMYHDQALIPLKLKSFGGSVNLTLGLPIIRTSPDHGTAFDIAGSGKAKPHSFIKAYNLAAEMANRKKQTADKM